MAEHPALTSARTVLLRALPLLKPIQLVRLAATAKLLTGQDDEILPFDSPDAPEQYEPQPYANDPTRATHDRDRK
jgi:hypothetical protein